MINLTPQELEEILDNVQDIKQRATTGIERMPEGTPQAQKYVEQILTDIKTNPGTYRAVHEGEGIQLALNAIQKAPQEARPALLEDYVRWQMTAAPEKIITKTICELAARLSPRKETTECDAYMSDVFRRVVFPAIKERVATLRKDKTSAEEAVLSLAHSASYFSIPEDLHKEFVRYAEQRARRVQQPRDMSDARMSALYSLMEFLKMSFTDEFNQLYVATSFFEDRWMSQEEKRPKRTNDNLAQAVNDAWKIAQQLWKKTHSSKELYSLFHNEHFQKTYATKNAAQTIAKDLALGMLRDGRKEDAQKIATAYHLTPTSPHGITPEDVAPIIAKHLLDGRYQLAQDISTTYGCAISEDMGTAAAANFDKQAQEHARAGRIDDAIKSRQRRKALDEFTQHGLDVTQIPLVGISEKYSGKILLMNFQGRTFLRGFPPHQRDGMHQNILNSFNEELNVLGYSGSPKPQGGAHIGFNKETGNRVIYDASGDYGECDKDIAAKLIKETFPAQKIVAERCNRGG